jgi:hypothetical protein
MKTSLLHSFKSWYRDLPIHKLSGGPARGTIGAALVVLERLREDCCLDLAHHQAEGGAQIKGLSSQSVAKILKRFGEKRPFLKEGGRTNRGVPGDIEKMLEALRLHGIDRLQATKRAEGITDLQQFLVDRVREFHNRQRLKVVYDPSKSSWQAIADILSLARENGKEGMVAQYLVGAKLALRFPGLPVQNLSYSTADDQLGRPGDFYLGNTAFHVTVAPMPAVYEKCRQNIDQGFRVYLLVPDRALVGARQNVDTVASGKVAVESIESFVSNNVEELSEFTKDRLRDGFKRLLDEYNRRVDLVETDKSLLIALPKNLQ